VLVCIEEGWELRRDHSHRRIEKSAQLRQEKMVGSFLLAKPSNLF